MTCTAFSRDRDLRTLTIYDDNRRDLEGGSGRAGGGGVVGGGMDYLRVWFTPTLAVIQQRMNGERW